MDWTRRVNVEHTWTKTLRHIRRRSSSSGQPGGGAAVEKCRITQNLYQSKALATRISNIISSNPKSSCIFQIEHKHIHDLNFHFIIHVYFLLIFQTNHISMLHATRSIHSCQENRKRRGSIFHHLEMQVVIHAWSSSHMLQINFLEPLLKLCAQRIGWKRLDLAQFPTSINMFMYMNCSKSCSIVQTKGWILLRIAWWTRLCKEIWCLWEEMKNPKREKNWREMENSRSEILFWRLWIRVWLLYGSLISLKSKLGIS